jgi:hypothetical protein
MFTLKIGGSMSTDLSNLIENLPYGLGRHFKPDPNDHKFLMKAQLPPPEEPIDYTDHLWQFIGDVLNQGRTGTCVGHGWEHWRHVAPIESDETESNAIAIYQQARTIDGEDPNDLQAGSNVRSGAVAITMTGELQSYLWAFQNSEVTSWVLRNGPVVVGMNWYDSMFFPTAEGFVKILPNAQRRGGHCWCVIGTDSKRAVHECVNSWGNGWGKNGHFYVAYEDMERLIHEDGEACTAVQQLVIPSLAA